MRQPTGPLHFTQNGSVLDVFQNTVATFNDPAVAEWFVEFFNNSSAYTKQIEELEDELAEAEKILKQERNGQ